jgi:hypothetical protein
MEPRGQGVFLCPGLFSRGAAQTPRSAFHLRGSPCKAHEAASERFHRPRLGLFWFMTACTDPGGAGVAGSSIGTAVCQERAWCENGTQCDASPAWLVEKVRQGDIRSPL